MTVILFALIGLLVGGIINVLADDLPARVRPRKPHCPQCGYAHTPTGWLASGRWLLQNGRCPHCGLPTRKRAPAVEISTMLVFGALPLLIADFTLLLITCFYFAVFILIIVIDMEHRLILHVVTFPTTLLALVLSNFMDGQNSFWLALFGALVGFIFFYIAYWVGYFLFGPGALGFGDVTLSMTMGAMLGLHRVVFALVLGILLGGLISLALIVFRRLSMRSRIPYGQFLAIAGMIMLVWGQSIFEWYIGQY